MIDRKDLAQILEVFFFWSTLRVRFRYSRITTSCFYIRKQAVKHKSVRVSVSIMRIAMMAISTKRFVFDSIKLNESPFIRVSIDLLCICRFVGKILIVDYFRVNSVSLYVDSTGSKFLTVFVALPSLTRI